MGASFSKRIVGYDKVQVNSYIYEFEKDYTEELDATNRKKAQEAENIKRLEGKITDLEDKLSKAIYFSAYIDKTDTDNGVVSIASDKILKEKEVSVEDIKTFYQKENEKLQQTILGLDKQIQEAKEELQTIINNMYSSVNNAFILHKGNENNEAVEELEGKNKESYISSIQDNIIGKKLTKDIEDDDGNLIAYNGETITQNIIDVAKDNNKILELFGGV